MKRNIFPYTLAIILSLSILTWALKLWKVDLSIPFVYLGDSLFNSMVIKGIIDNGWYLNNQYLGMPFGLELYDFPMSDNLHLTLIWLISFFSSDFAKTMNLFYLLTFPITTFCSLFVFRQFNFSFAPSIIVSLLFTFVPYHFLRGEVHLFLASYYMIPLMTMVILWFFSGELTLFQKGTSKSNLKLNLFNFKFFSSSVVCLLVASSGVYFAFFACFFLVVATLATFINKKNTQYLITGGILSGVITLGVIANIAPSLIYIYHFGKNIESALRSSIEAEIYGMKILRLLFPIDDYGFNFLASLRSIYSQAPLGSGTEYLGLVGSFGFLLLILKLLKRSNIFEKEALLENLSILNIFAVMLGTIGGFGSLFALIFSPRIRCYDRISIYIAFFSLFAVLILVDSLYQRTKPNTLRKYLFIFLLGLILLAGIFEQTNFLEKTLPQHEWVKSRFIHDRNFIKKIELTMPKSAMIFQLPYFPFPEHGNVYKISDYDLFKGYLHSKTLRWSYGLMKGRKGSLWQRYNSNKPPREFINIISFAGFSGIYIDRYGYIDMGSEIESKLSNILETKPMISPDNRLVFFDMTQYIKKLRTQYTEAQWDANRRILLDLTQYSQTTSYKPLPYEGCQAAISIIQPPSKIKVNSVFNIVVNVKNLSNVVWPSKIQSGGKYMIALSYHWLDEGGRTVIHDGLRTPLFFDLSPGKNILLNTIIKAPDKKGDYILEFDMLQEGVTWFKNKGSKPAKINLVIE